MLAPVALAVVLSRRLWLHAKVLGCEYQHMEGAKKVYGRATYVLQQAALQSHKQLMFARADGAHSAEQKEFAAEQVSAVSAAR